MAKSIGPGNREPGADTCIDKSRVILGKLLNFSKRQVPHLNRKIVILIHCDCSRFKCNNTLKTIRLEPGTE